MRDDLHRTVAVSRHWKKVLRYLPREADRKEKLPAAIGQALRAELAAEIRKSWAEPLKRAVSSIESDFFESDPIAGVVDQFERKAISVAERDLCEFIRGRSVRGTKGNLFDIAMNDLVKNSANQNFEHLVAKVRQDAGAGQASEVRGCLEDAKNASSFDEPPASNRNSRKQKGADVFDLLDRPVEVKGIV